MGEAADSLWAMKAAYQYRKKQDREAAPGILAAAGIDFKSFNNGAHLRINAKGIDIDFWPGTGRWIVGRSKARHGIESLIKFCNEGLIMGCPDDTDKWIAHYEAWKKANHAK